MPYQTDADKIRRQRLMAESLMTSGASPIQEYSAGGVPAPISPWQGAAKLAQTALGAWQMNRADKAEGELEEQRQAGLEEWVGQMPTDRNELLSWALKGQQYGGMGESLGGAVASQALSPQDRNVKVVGDRLYDVDAGTWVDMPEGGSTGAGFGKVNPRDFTPDSLAAYSQSGDFNDLVRFEPFQQVDVGGVPHILDRRTGAMYQGSIAPGAPPSQQPGAAGGSPQTLGDVVSPKTVTTDSVAESEAEIAATRKDAELRAQHDAERDFNRPKEVQGLRQQLASIDNVMTTIDQAMAEVDGLSTGLIGKGLSLVPGTDAYDLDKLVTTVKANLGFDKLQAMRDASPTGGALGQVAIQELEALQANIGSLDLGQGQEQLLDNMRKVQHHYQNWRNIMTQAKAEQGVTLPEAPAAPEGTDEPVSLDSADPDAHYDSLPSGALFVAPDGTTRRKP